jgi:hypothetical protein
MLNHKIWVNVRYVLNETRFSRAIFFSSSTAEGPIPCNRLTSSKVHFAKSAGE